MIEPRHFVLLFVTQCRRWRAQAEAANAIAVQTNTTVRCPQMCDKPCPLNDSFSASVR
jgi:hypothetical protein